MDRCLTLKELIRRLQQIERALDGRDCRVRMVTIAADCGVFCAELQSDAGGAEFVVLQSDEEEAAEEPARRYRNE